MNYWEGHSTYELSDILLIEKLMTYCTQENDGKGPVLSHDSPWNWEIKSICRREGVRNRQQDCTLGHKYILELTLVEL